MSKRRSMKIFKSIIIGVIFSFGIIHQAHTQGAPATDDLLPPPVLDENEEGQGGDLFPDEILEGSPEEDPPNGIGGELMSLQDSLDRVEPCCLCGSTEHRTGPMCEADESSQDAACKSVGCTWEKDEKKCKGAPPYDAECYKTKDGGACWGYVWEDKNVENPDHYQAVSEIPDSACNEQVCCEICTGVQPANCSLIVTTKAKCGCEAMEAVEYKKSVIVIASGNPDGTVREDLDPAKGCAEKPTPKPIDTPIPSESGMPGNSLMPIPNGQATDDTPFLPPSESPPPAEDVKPAVPETPAPSPGPLGPNDITKADTPAPATKPQDSSSPNGKLVWNDKNDAGPVPNPSSSPSGFGRVLNWFRNLVR